MQFQAVLCNRQHPEYGVATIPFPIPGTEYENVIRLLEPLGLGDEVKQDCHIEEIRGDIPALKQIERTNANLDELDYLAKRLDSFDAYELTQFQGMASRLSLHSVERFINLTFCCQESTVISDFTHLDAIGRKHFLTLNGGCASKCKAGMSKEVIQSMYEYDCDTFLSDRRYREHTQPLPSECIGDSDEDSMSGLFKKFDSLKVSFSESDFSGRYSWVETIEDSGLSSKLSALSAEDIELLTMYVFDEYTQSEIALRIGLSQRGVGKRIERIGKFLK